MAHVAHARVPLPTALPLLLGLELSDDALQEVLLQHLLGQLRAQRVAAPEDLQEELFHVVVQQAAPRVFEEDLAKITDIKAKITTSSSFDHFDHQLFTRCYSILELSAGEGLTSMHLGSSWLFSTASKIMSRPLLRHKRDPNAAKLRVNPS